MNKNVNKIKLIDIIHKKLGKTLHKDVLRDAINIINENLLEMILNDKTISVENFGTLSPFIFHSHKGIDINTFKIRQTKELKTVKFRIHTVFQELINQRRDKFLKVKKKT